MEKGLRNAVLGVIGTIIVAFCGAWVQITSRISILEVQVRNDHDMFMANQDKADARMNEIIEKINDIQIKVTHLNDVKQDRIK